MHVLTCNYFYVYLFYSSRVINVSLPKKTRNNGTLYAIIFVHQAGVNPWQDPRKVHSVAHLTTYMVPKPPEISLISREDQTLVLLVLVVVVTYVILLERLLSFPLPCRARQKKPRRRSSATLTPPLGPGSDPGPRRITQLPTGARA